jgi:NAD(P)-dependent dehydrogenase (short-subunit alcohol dehydrogenase family)
MKFAGKIATVFGASSEGGTGWAIAEVLAGHGAHVVVSARSMPGLERLAEKIGATAVRCDVSVEEDVAAKAAFIKERFGQLDMVIVSAGQPVASSVIDSPFDDLLRATAINYFGPFFAIKHMVPLLRPEGSVTVISSLASTNPIEGQVAYGAAKAATNALVQYAAIELGPKGFRVNAVVPGSIETPLLTEFLATAPEIRDTYIKEIPSRRYATALDIANAAVWMASPECFANGSLLHVDGGNYLTRQPYLSELPEGIMSKL